MITKIIDSMGAGPGKTLFAPHDIAVDDSGNVYVVGFGSANAFKISIGPHLDIKPGSCPNPVNPSETVAVQLHGVAVVERSPIPGLT